MVQGEGYRLYLGDCLEVMAGMTGPMDAIIADLPYGTTACEWDSVIPLDKLWTQFKRLNRPQRAIVLFGSFPFTGALWASNPDWFKYSLVWQKSMLGDIMNAKNKPLKKHEDILIFSDGTTTNCSERRMMYNPQGLKRIDVHRKNYYRLDGQATFKPKRPSHGLFLHQENTNYPHSVLCFSNGNHNSPHPTAKPVDLLAYLIRTYTNPGETVLDCTCGSGTTIVAAIQEGRYGIGIEKDEGYFDISVKRCADASRAARGLPKQLKDDRTHTDLPLFAEAAS